MLPMLVIINLELLHTKQTKAESTSNLDSKEKTWTE
jgi:hypothetical protein